MNLRAFSGGVTHLERSTLFGALHLSWSPPPPTCDFAASLLEPRVTQETGAVHIQGERPGG